jgi:hypothetical protein
MCAVSQPVNQPEIIGGTGLALPVVRARSQEEGFAEFGPHPVPCWPPERAPCIRDGELYFRRQDPCSYGDANQLRPRGGFPANRFPM